MPVRIPVKFDNELVIINGIYYYRGTPVGTKKRREVSLDLKVGALQKDVLKKKRDVLEKLQQLWKSTGSTNFRVLALAFLESRKKEIVSKTQPYGITLGTYKEAENIMNKYLIKSFGTMRVEDIGQDEFDDHCKDYPQFNMISHRKIINNFFGWCNEKKIIRGVPRIKVPKFAKKSRRKRVVLTDEQIQRIFKNADGFILLYISMYMLMGMRNMEILALRWDEVDFKTRQLKVNPNNNRVRRGRTIPINSFVIGLLKKALDWRPGDHRDAWVFPSQSPKNKSPHIHAGGGHRVAWNKLLEDSDLGIHITPHDLRATFETFMHTNVEFTDTQREKMAGAKIDIQKEIYVSMEAKKLKGLEESVQVKGLKRILGEKTGDKKLKKVTWGSSND